MTVTTSATTRPAPFDLATVDRLLTCTRAARRSLDLRRPVDRATIEECLEIAVHAPTASNRQSWRWVVVTDPAVKEGIAHFYRLAWEHYLSMTSNRAGRRARAAAAEGRGPDNNLLSARFLVEHLAEIPVLIVPCLQGRPPGAEAIDRRLRASFESLEATGHTSLRGAEPVRPKLDGPRTPGGLLRLDLPCHVVPPARVAQSGAGLRDHIHARPLRATGGRAARHSLVSHPGRAAAGGSPVPGGRAVPATHGVRGDAVGALVSESATPRRARRLAPDLPGSDSFPGSGHATGGHRRRPPPCAPPVRAALELASRHLRFDVLRLCATGPEAELISTARAQCVVTAWNLALLECLDLRTEHVAGVAGHSAGELSALAGAGALAPTRPSSSRRAEPGRCPRAAPGAACSP